MYHSTLGLRVIKKDLEVREGEEDKLHVLGAREEAVELAQLHRRHDVVLRLGVRVEC